MAFVLESVREPFQGLHTWVPGRELTTPWYRVWTNPWCCSFLFLSFLFVFAEKETLLHEKLSVHASAFSLVTLLADIEEMRSKGLALGGVGLMPIMVFMARTTPAVFTCQEDSQVGAGR